MRLCNILHTFQMSDTQEFSNDSEDEQAAKEEEGKTLAASDSWIGLANSTPHRLKVKTYSEYVREVETKGEEILKLPYNGHNLSHIYKQLTVGLGIGFFIRLFCPD